MADNLLRRLQSALAKGDALGGDEAWPLVVEMARRKRIPVELIVEYTTGSHAGRKMRLAYDPVLDRESRDWLQ